MAYIALIVWFVTVLWGLYMLAVWLIENDATRQGKSASRLPLPVILSHVTLAVTGLGVWAAYLLFDQPLLAWAAVGILTGIVLLGYAMFARWIPVYRMSGDEIHAPYRMAEDEIHVPVGATVGAVLYGRPTVAPQREQPAEGSFPLVVVLAHGAFATCTVVLVVLTALGVGGS